MSGRDDQPATVPPPAGEDDAYNAATKVGAMPAEVMAKLRAEGLLPDEEPSRSARPAPAAGAPAPGIPRPASTPRVHMPPSVRDSLPDMSDPDDTDERTVLSQSSPALASSPYGFALPAQGYAPAPAYSQPPPQPMYSQPPPPATYPQPPVYAHAPTPAETPIAFGSGPAWPQPSGAPPAFPTPSFMPPAPIAFRESDAGVTQEVRAFGGKRSRASTVITVVVSILVVILVAFAMAMLSHRR